MKNVLKKILLFSFLALGFLLFIYLITGFFYPEVQSIIEDLLLAFVNSLMGWFFYLIIILVPFIIGELFLYKVKSKSKLSLFLPFILYLVLLVVVFGFYFIVRPSYSEGMFGMFLLALVFVFAPVVIIVYSLARVIIFRVKIRKGSRRLTIIEVFLDKYIKNNKTML